MTTPPNHATMVNAFSPDNMASLDPAMQDSVKKRLRLLGPAYRLFYQNPVQVSRGAGVHLYDRDGHEYLDAYNNVVSVGHAHPRVADAICRQAHTLCTHTRYVQDGILRYSDEILGTFGGKLGATGHMMSVSYTHLTLPTKA
mgnify:CR=1 FL=1